MVEDLDTSVVDKQRIKDQLGTKDTSQFVFGRFKAEEMNVVDSNLLVESKSIGTAFIVGHSVSGKLGTQAPQNVLGNGTIGSYSNVENLTTDQQITNAGRAQIRNWLYNDSGTHPQYTGYGTGTTAFLTTQTTLVTETAVTRPVTTNSNAVAKTITYIGEYTDKSTANVREVGLFSAASTGTMYCRRVVADLDMSTNTFYRFTFTIVLSDVV